MPPSTPTAARVCVGQFAGAHGVRGLVKLRSFTAAPGDVGRYGPVVTADGHPVRFTVKGPARPSAPELLLVTVDGIADRDAAQALNGVRLFVERAALPPTEDDEFYHADLLGLAATTPDGQPLGRVAAVHDFGGGELLEIVAAGREPLLVPFTRAAVPVVDVAGGRLVVDPPAEAPDQETAA